MALRAIDVQEGSTPGQGQSAEVQIARLEMMLEVSRALNSTLDLDVLLRSIIETATELIETEAASILLIDESKGGDQLHAVTGSRKQAQVTVNVVPLEGSVAGWVIKSGEPVTIYDIQQDDRQFSEVDQLGQLEVREILGVPLTVKNKVIGVIEVINKKLRQAIFTGGDLQTLSTLATQAAIAIENARLFKQNDQLVNVFHELRSPMTSIIGFSRLMLASPTIDLDDVRIGLNSINREATRLSQIVNDFLDLTKIETGRVFMIKEAVDLQTLITEVIELFYPQSLEKEVSLTLEVIGTAPEISADRDRLKQVMINLVDNAIKFNHQGGSVEITLSCNEVRVQVAIQDSGWGIDSADLDLVFDKFYRARRDDEEKVRGAGLGLALVKEIIDAHGGDIWIESTLNEGSTFTFSLPL